MIIIDSREISLIEELTKQKIPHQIKHLSVGDLVCGDCVIERKEANDFVASICDGRLLKQCQNMMQYYKRAFIVVHGNLSETSSMVHTHASLGMLASITARAGIPILMVNTLADVAYLSWKIMEKATDGKPFNYEIAVKSQNRDKRLDILTLIDGISLEKAKAIVERYPLFRGLVEASSEELSSIKGVGGKLAGNIHSFFSIFRN